MCAYSTVRYKVGGGFPLLIFFRVGSTSIVGYSIYNWRSFCYYDSVVPSEVML